MCMFALWGLICTETVCDSSQRTLVFVNGIFFVNFLERQ